jgi:hypothetical protein
VTDDELKAAFDRGKTEWPQVTSLTPEAFRAFVDAAAVEPPALEERSGDLFLAAAAATMTR